MRFSPPAAPTAPATIDKVGRAIQAPPENTNINITRNSARRHLKIAGKAMNLSDVAVGAAAHIPRIAGALHG
jgi:hypothetical protein